MAEDDFEAARNLLLLAHSKVQLEDEELVLWLVALADDEALAEDEIRPGLCIRYQVREKNRFLCDGQQSN